MPRFADHSLFPELPSANGNCLPWETVQCLPSPPPTPGVKDWLIQSKAVLPYCFKAETTLWGCLCPRGPLWIGPRPPEMTFWISPISCPFLLSFLLVGFSREYTLHKLHASETSCFSVRDINLRWRRRGEKKPPQYLLQLQQLYMLEIGFLNVGPIWFDDSDHWEWGQSCCSPHGPLSTPQLLSRAWEPRARALRMRFRLSVQLSNQVVDKLTREGPIKNQKVSCHEARWPGILLLAPDIQA